MVKNIKEDKNNTDKIIWFGMDGFLILAYFILVGVMLSSLYFGFDFLIAYVFPFTLLFIVWLVAFNYAKTLTSFIRIQRKNR